jgi:hypothetical protein
MSNDEVYGMTVILNGGRVASSVAARSASFSQKVARYSEARIERYECAAAVQRNLHFWPCRKNSEASTPTAGSS